jgi:alpha-tubulin suppressor-like RCC1 family protein
VPVSGGLVFAQITTGGTHTCGLTTGGAAYCWGLGLSGQLGDNAGINRSAPVLVAGGNTFASLTAGGNHTCGLTAAGAAYCWGLNSFGQVGDGTSSAGANRVVPTLVSGGHVFVRLSAGNAHTCGITDGGESYCWGSNGSVANPGKLGDGTTASQRVVPTLVVGGIVFTDIIAAGTHTCARTATGALHCWGANDAGQLGDGTTTSRTAPTPVTGGVTWDAFGAGNFHACAIRDAGRTFCWGQNSQGAIGDGTVANRNAPVAVRP